LSRSPVSMWHFLAGFFSRNKPDFMNKFMDASYAWNCDPMKFTTKSSLKLSSKTTVPI
jgi:hypothetical protein